MKKQFKWMTLALLFAAAGNVLTACDDDDDNKQQENLGDEMGIMTYDGLSYFQSQFVKVDENGNFMERRNGEPLNAADTTIVSLGVSNVEEAKELFINWLPDDANYIENDNRIIYEPKDEEGQAQGTIFFTPQSEGEVLATVTFAEGTNINFISKIEFIDQAAWPHNGESIHREGDIVSVYIKKFPDFEGDHDYLCIREAKNGQTGLLVLLSNFTSKGLYADKYCVDMATESQAKEVSKVIRSNWDKYYNMFKKVNKNDLEDRDYWYNRRKAPAINLGAYYITIKTGDCDWSATIKYRKKYNMFVKEFSTME